MNRDITLSRSLWRPMEIIPMEIIEYTVTILVLAGGSLCILGWLLTATGSLPFSLLPWGAGIVLSAGYAGFHPPIRTLLRLQTRILLWTWIIPAVVIPLAWMVGYEECLNGTMVVMSIASWLAGGLLFGAEYVEGAKGYIQTRPVSGNAVLYGKLVVLFCMVLIYANLLHLVHVLPPKAPLRILDTPFPSLIFLSTALASAVFTVLFRDVVRGLWVSAVFMVIIYFLYFHFSLYYLGFLPFLYAPGELIAPWNPFSTLISISIVFIFILLMLTILIVVFHSHWSHRPKFPAMSIISSALCFMPLHTAVLCCWNEGSVTLVKAFPGYPMGWHLQGDQLSWIENNVNEDLTIKHLDLSDPQSLPSSPVILSSTPCSRHSNVFYGDIVIIVSQLPESLHPGDTDFPINTPLAPLFNQYTVSGDFQGPKYCIKVFRLKGTDSPDLLSKNLVVNVRHRPGTQETYYQNEDQSWGHIDWVSGNNTALTEDPIISGPHSSDLSELVRTCVWNPTDATDGEWTASLINPVEEPTGDSQKDSQPIMGKEISLFKKLDNGTRDETIIQIPDRFFNTPYLGLKILQHTGLPSGLVIKTQQHFSKYFYLTLGGGFLCLWHGEIGRVAVWRVTDPYGPEFIGIAPTTIHINDWTVGLVESPLPPVFRNAAPYVRSDGALGYLLPLGGILWLEFPALMKEAKS